MLATNKYSCCCFYVFLLNIKFPFLMHSSGVKHTCPDIDRIKKTLLQMVKDMEYYSKSEDVDALQSFLYSSSSELYSMTDDLEDLRAANSDLRLWGKDF